MDIAGLSSFGAYGAIRPTPPVSPPQAVENTPAVGGAGGSQNGGAANSAPNDKPLSGFGPRLGGGGVQSTLLAAQETAQDAAKTPAPAQVASGRGPKAPSSLNLSV